jgi:hypothetical protein
MDTKGEGVAFPPIPVSPRFERQLVGLDAGARREAGEPRCEMCSAPVVASHCKRVCLRCGFMTGCSEGIS